MSEQTISESEELFAPEEIKQFDADDAEAGENIGKMLSVFFLYTVIAMTSMTVLTYYWIATSNVS
ncbi:hypothetical protein [Thalassoglobus sp.]|uniref:hypothetical protein n=1 Tax=Thalassoglobus sp. TaxID=2795869 RepID=UPI003AA8C4E1